MDELRVYDRPLTPFEIEALANKDLTAFEEISLDSRVLVYPNPIKDRCVGFEECYK